MSKNHKNKRNSEKFKLLYDRKAQVETQFNWIFILVVGAIILVFFIGIVMKQKASSEIKISETVMTDLQSIFTGGSISTGTSQLIETPKVDIGFDCSNYYLKGVTRPVENLIIFAPASILGRNILTWTLDYNLPYKITNFLYVTTPEMRYVFVTSNQKKILKWNTTLPEEMNVEFVKDISQIEDKNNYKVRLIVFRDPADMINPIFPEKLDHLKGKDLTALWIQEDILRFYESDGTKFVPQNNNEATYPVDMDNQQLDPSVYGAIFTDDIELYNCMIGKALERAYYVSKVYSDRNRNISQYFEDTNSYCKNYAYSPDSFDKYVESIEDLYENFPDSTNLPNGVISIAENAIARQNKVLLQKSCPLIY